jgi:polyisoprenoid-binding protein YceI
MNISKTIAIVLLTCSALGANAGAIDPAKSTVTATFKQMGVAVDAKFTQFSGNIDYDAANVAAAKAHIALQVSSFDIGDAEYNREVQKKEWFNAAQFPQATFVASTIKSLAANKLQAQGKLTIKGKTLDVNIPIEVKQNGGAQMFSGTLPIKRLYFNIGEGEWKDTEMLADEVVVKFNIVTNR